MVIINLTNYYDNSYDDELKVQQQAQSLFSTKHDYRPSRIAMLLLRVGPGFDEIDEQLQIYVVENTSYRTPTLSSS